MSVNKWTLEKFLKKAKTIHGDKYDYSNIKEFHIKNNKSKVEIKCNKCNHIWYPSITNFILEKSKCICYKINKLTLEKFLEKAKTIHGDKYDYSNIKETDIINCYSKIKIKCNKCDYIWNTTTAGSHIYDKRGCPNCSGSIRWNISRFLQGAKKIHGNKYDYSNIKEFNVNSYNNIIVICKKCNNNIIVICKKCNNNWITCISNHITKEYGCPKCAINSWSIQRFLQEAIQIHGDKYDYSNIKECDIKTGESKIDITCNKCKNRWNTTSVVSHINNRSGCPKCRKSKL